MSKYTVYKIQTFSVPDNQYTTGRIENWNLQHDVDFDNEKEARLYIKEKTREHTDLALFSIRYKDKVEKEKFIEEFCFSDKYIQYQRYFLGEPDVKKIKQALVNQGINVVNYNASN